MEEKKKYFYINNPVEFLDSKILIGYEQLIHLN